MTEVDLSMFRPRGAGPNRDILQRCRSHRHKAMLYLANRSVLMLRDDDSRSWYLYNDNSDRDVRVIARFRLSRDRVRAMQEKYRSPFVLPIECPSSGDTTVEEIAPSTPLSTNGPTPKHVFVRALVTVPALETRPFISYDTDADVADVVLDFSSEAAGKDPSLVHFRGGPASATGATPPFRAASGVGRRVNGPDMHLLRGCNRVYPCFRGLETDDAELLYRLVTVKPASRGVPLREMWAFYNDSTDYSITVQATFENAAEVTPLGKTQRLEYTPPRADSSAASRVAAASIVRGAADNDAWVSGTDASIQPVTLHLTVPPLTTELFMVGRPVAYPELTYSARAVTNETPESGEVDFVGAGPDEAVIKHDQMFCCYPDKGNGLLFHLVDTNGQRWAFYNDAPEQSFTVTAVLSPSGGNDLSGLVPGPTAKHVEADDSDHGLTLEPFPTPRTALRGGDRSASTAVTPEKTAEAPASNAATPPGTVTLRLTVPPGKTLLLLRGVLPLRYLLRYEMGNNDSKKDKRSDDNGEAELLDHPGSPASSNEVESVGDGPENFTLDGPNKKEFPYDKVCRTPGQDVYRLVSAGGNSWGFYNDAPHARAFVAVKFNGSGGAFIDGRSPGVAPLGMAQLVSVPQARRTDEKNGTPSALPTPEPVSPLGEAVSPSTMCPEVLLTIGPGETLPFAQALRPQAVQQYHLFIRVDPVLTEGSGSYTAAAEARFAHADAAQVMRATVRPERVCPCLRNSDQKPLLYHLERAIPSPTLAAATAHAGLGGGVPQLSADEEERVLHGRPTRWSLYNDTTRHCFIVKYRLDARSAVRALGTTRLSTPGVSAAGLHSSQPPQTPSPATGSPALVAPLLRGSPAAATAAEGTIARAHRTPRRGILPSSSASRDGSVHSPLDHTRDDIYLQDRTLDSGTDSGTITFTAVVDPLCTVSVLEGDVVGGVNLQARVDAARENSLITFNNGQPRIFASEAAFLEQSRATLDHSSASWTSRTLGSTAAAGTRTAAGTRPASGSPVEDCMDNMLESTQLRFYRLMPTHFNGLLFRIVDDKSGLWSFYNDTSMYRFTVRVLFSHGSVVSAAGNARDVTERERRAARRQSMSSGTVGVHSHSGSLSGPQRRLSESRGAPASPLGNSISAFSTADAAAFNFFADPAAMDDETARVFEVDVGPEQTELLVLAEDVVRFRNAWFATPVVTETALNRD